MDSTAFASPYPQTPTPGGSANPNLPNRPPLTSLKPFGYTGPPKALIRKPHTPHPLAQVSMIDSLSTIANDSHSHNRQPNGSHNNITLNQPRVHPDQSLEEDLRAFEQEQRNLQRRPIYPRTSRVSDDLTEDEDYDQDDDENSQSAQTTTIDDHDEMEDSEFDRDSGSLRIGLSSLSPPGIGRAAHHPGQLSTVTLDPEEDFTYQGGQDFSRDLSALSLSPIRRPSAPTPQRVNAPANDHDLTMDDQRSEISQTPVSGFQGMARQLRHDFEQLTGVPTHHGRPQAKKGNNITAKQSARGGTLKGGLPANDGTRAKRVFGSDLDQGLKPPRLNQLHSAGLTSTPPAKSHATKPAQQDPNQQRGRNTLSDLKNHMSSRPPSHQLHQPSIRIVDATTDSNHPTGHDSSLAPAARRIVGNSVRVPDVTGLTDALRSPDKADFPLGGNAPSGARPSSESARPDPTLSEALTLLRRRLGSLETENEACQNLIRDLQSQLNHANQIITMKAGQASQGQPDRSQATHKADMERMLQKIKIHTRRLTDSIQAHAIAIDELNAFKTRNKSVRQELVGVKSEVRQWSDEVEDMKGSLEGLTSEVREMRSMIERLVKTASQSSSAINTQTSGPTQPGMSRRSTKMTKPSDPKAPLSKSQQPVKHRLPPVSAQQPTQSRGTRHDIEDWRSQTSTIQISGQSFIGPDEIQNLRKDVEQEQLLKLAAQAAPKARADPTNTNPSASSSRPPPAVKKPTLASSRAPPTRTSSAPIMKLGGTTEPAKATDEVSRGEAILNSLPKGRHDDMSCSQCRLRRQQSGGSHTLSNRTSSAPVVSMPSRKKEEKDEPLDEEENLPPQAVLVGILRDLEEDFEVHRKIFVELSDTYRKMNPASIQVSKRKALAQHLRESVDTLEKKAGHIKHLYDLLHVKDLPGKAGSSRKV